MAVLLSGDFHANAAGELSIITKKNLIKKFGLKKYSAINCQIILGDAGFLWHGNEKTDAYNYRVLAKRPFPVFCVIGNHEPMLGMNLPLVDIGIGENVYIVNKNPFVAYLKRGGIYNIDGFKFLAMGGALSIDQEYRIPGRSWWKEEYWSQKEKNDLFELLSCDSAFDYVLTHTGPDNINWKVFNSFFAGSDKFTDEVAKLNEVVDSRINCKGWYCGHWHHDCIFIDAEKNRSYQYFYRDTGLLEN